MFWSSFSPPSIRRARLDGSDISVLLDSGLSFPCMLYNLRVLANYDDSSVSTLFTVLQSSKDFQIFTNHDLLQLLQQKRKEGDYPSKRQIILLKLHFVLKVMVIVLKQSKTSHAIIYLQICKLTICSTTTRFSSFNLPIPFGVQLVLLVKTYCICENELHLHHVHFNLTFPIYL